MGDSLKTDICKVLHHDMLMRCPLFSRWKEIAIVNLAMRMRPMFFMPEEVLMQEGAVGREMMFLKAGIVYIVKQGAGIVGQRSDVGDFFGEMALLEALVWNRPSYRTASIQA